MLPHAAVRLRDRWTDGGARLFDDPEAEEAVLLELEEDMADRGDAHALRRLGYRR